MNISNGSKEKGRNANGRFRPKPFSVAFVLTLFLCFFQTIDAKKLAKVKSGLKYEDGQEVGIIVNSVG